jgi:hypothetical protein
MIKFKKLSALLLLFILPFLAIAQSNNFPQGSKETILLERLEIKYQTDSVLNFSQFRNFNRKWWAQRLIQIQKDTSKKDITPIDKYNITRSLMNNLEWVEGDSTPYLSKKKFHKGLFVTPANFFEVDQPEFSLIINPVFQFVVGNDETNPNTMYLNSRGISIRGLINKKIGFYTYLTENQEVAPLYVQRWQTKYRAVPGQGRYKELGDGGKDYFDGRGGVTFSDTKHVDVQIGYDKMFLGNGFRSLFLSDFSNSYLYANLNLKIWKLNYTLRMMELTRQFTQPAKDTLTPTKYMVMHYVSLNLPKWLNIGIYEAIVFARRDNFELNYINPAIFLRPIELNRGSVDNAFVGFDFKANLKNKFQIYGQANFDEFFFSELRKGRGWWANKFALQLGGKYIDAFNIKNLDLQSEINFIKPFTYSHSDTILNYSNYNQPLAHPLQSNVLEMVNIARYQPKPKWYLEGKIIGWIQGTDVNGDNYGNNIFRDNDTRLKNTGFYLGTGLARKGVNGNFLLSYEWKENLFLEFNFLRRMFTLEDATTTASIGVRMNMSRRQFDF